MKSHNKTSLLLALALIFSLVGLWFFPGLIAESTVNFGYQAFEIGVVEREQPSVAFIAFGGPRKTQITAIDSNRDGIVDVQFSIRMDRGETTCRIDHDLDGYFDQLKRVEADGGLPKLSAEKHKGARKAASIQEYRRSTE